MYVYGIWLMDVYIVDHTFYLENNQNGVISKIATIVNKRM